MVVLGGKEVSGCRRIGVDPERQEMFLTRKQLPSKSQCHKILPESTPSLLAFWPIRFLRGAYSLLCRRGS
jgi:hypothetical protein